jgi:hypothetical protein
MVEAFYTVIMAAPLSDKPLLLVTLIVIANHYRLYWPFNVFEEVLI